VAELRRADVADAAEGSRTFNEGSTRARLIGDEHARLFLCLWSVARRLNLAVETQLQMKSTEIASSPRAREHSMLPSIVVPPGMEGVRALVDQDRREILAAINVVAADQDHAILALNVTPWMLPSKATSSASAYPPLLSGVPLGEELRDDLPKRRVERRRHDASYHD
jgi:hypothetical protein